MGRSDYVDVVLTEGPGPMSTFVELEDASGAGIGKPRAEWVDRGDGYAVLRIYDSLPTPSAVDAARDEFVVQARYYACHGTEEHRLWMMTAHRRLLAAEQEMEAPDGD